jgi:hypothetical protein
VASSHDSRERLILTATIEDLRFEGDSAPEGKGALSIMDRTGDSRFGWDPNNAEEVRLAREHFDSLRGKRYLAYRVNAQGGRGETIHEFDPAAREIIMAPQTVGG